VGSEKRKIDRIDDLGDSNERFELFTKGLLTDKGIKHT
jgi:hypothetical protein